MGRHKKSAIILFSIAVNYLVIEYFVWRPLLEYVPVPLQSELGRLAPLAQSSKNGFVPKDYLLLIGDSYAEGHGDWLMRTIGELRPKYHTPHVIHDRSGRDVLSFGFRGGYPGHSFTFETTRTFHGLKQYAFLGLDAPKDVLVYFSEPTDVNDEIISAKIWLAPSTDLTQLDDLKKVRALVDARGRDGQISIEKRWNVFRNAHMFDTFTKLVKLMAKNIASGNALFTPADSGFAHGRDYRPKWSQYQSSSVRMLWQKGELPYPNHSLEPFAFSRPDEIRYSANIFEAALGYLQSYFPKSKLWVAYVPSPLSVYRFQDKYLELRDRIRFPTHELSGPVTRFSVNQLRTQSDRLCNAVLGASARAGARFIDTRAYLRDKSWEQGYLHGPSDPGHLNQAGYTALAERLMQGLAAGGDKECARLENAADGK